ncbi:MAG: glycosyltransferase, partial [Anaerolineae bacterium]
LFAEYLTWNTPYRVGSHYYARHFLDLGWEVGWLGGEFHSWNLVKNRSELRRKVPLWVSGGVQHPDGPWEYVPCKLLPYRNWGPLRSPALAWRGKRLTVPPIKRILGRNAFDCADLLWLSNPQAYPWLIGEPGYTRIVYRAADNHALSEGIPASVAAIEARIARRADAVFVVHPDSLERFRRSAPERTVYLPNGVALTRFAGACPRPPEYGPLTGPIAVYVGSINYRFDTRLLGDVAARRPDITFVIVGEPVIDVSRLSSAPNVILLGPRSPESVPGYLGHAQVGLIPFRDLPATRDLLSIKIYEYAASGLPTIHSTMTPAAAAGLPVLTAPDVESFCHALDRALLWTSAEREAARAFAAANSWEDRYRRVDDILEGWWPSP